MLDLQDREWKEFRICDIFIINAGKRLTKADMISGDKPFVGATDSNNGITEFVSNTNVSEDRNVLGVNYNGSVVENFFHPYTCIFSDDVKRFKLKNANGNEYIYLFLKTIILQQKTKYTYGYKFNEKRMSKQLLLLPVNDNGKPDYAFMEQYIKEREQQIVQKYIDFIGSNIQIGGAITPLNQKEWKAFRLLDFFNFAKGNQNNMADLAPGAMPLISARNVNNGYKAFVAKNPKKESFKGNCITINNDGDGGAGISYYQPFDMLLDTHVTALYPKEKMSFSTMLFISACITIQRKKFGHGYSLNNARLSAFRIMLPITENETPDYAYMEQYAKQQLDVLKLQYLQEKAANA